MSELLKKLLYIKQFQCFNFNTYIKLIELANERNSWLELKYPDKFKSENYNIEQDILSKDNWITYKDGFKLYINSDLIADITKFNSDHASKIWRDSERWEGKIQLTEEDLLLFKSEIDCSFYMYVIDVHRQEEKEKYDLEIKNLSDKLLSSC